VTDEAQTWGFASWQRAVFVAIRNGEITPGAALTALCLESYADHGTGRNARPGISRLSDDVRAGESTIRRHLAELVSAGLIELVHRGGGLSRLASVYRMTLPNSAHQRAEMANSAQYSAQYSAHHSMSTSLTSLTSLGRDTGRDAHAKREHRIAQAINKIINGEYEYFESDAGSAQYGSIPGRFYDEHPIGDGSTYNTDAARRFLCEAATAIEETGKVADGLAYLCTAQAFAMSDAQFLVRVLAALKSPTAFTKSAS